MKRIISGIVLTLTCIAPLSYLALAGEPAAAPPAANEPPKDPPKNPTTDSKLTWTGQPVSADVKLQYATFGAGCFWGVEQRFRETAGVITTGVGYAGGNTPEPTYKQVCSDTTGHAEVVQVQFDPTKTSYEALLQVFWDNHNPTTLNRQGPDYGSQYRSVIFFHDDAQKAAAEKSKQAVADSGKWNGKPIVTEIAVYTKFHAAEDYHQQYLEKRGVKVCH
jgi:peptide-methionine (S)-S-oxide reductase